MTVLSRRCIGNVSLPIGGVTDLNLLTCPYFDQKVALSTTNNYICTRRSDICGRLAGGLRLARSDILVTKVLWAWTEKRNR